jgi:tRNA A-37 threonylcarbamoyl transferase component Bud32/tetratricopeptide (TPR) repeat protein
MADRKPGKHGLSDSNETLLPGGDRPVPEISLDHVTTQVPLARFSTFSFTPDEVVAGRFKILRFVARGGMGEVYEAEDLELKERIALKAVRLEMAQHGRSVDRFRREIQLARRVTHPNVCRTFDVFRHAQANEDGSTREILVVSMELLAGETLEQRIRRTGRFSTSAALPIVVQMAAGLQAAHQAGIVHRDFKSSNIILITAGDDSGKVRAVITDFGLAHANTTFSGQSLTGSNDLVGTPAYMAPEQLHGGEITSRTDVYALGVVMFEMVTGGVPFVGDTPLATALKRLNEPAPSPRKLVSGLDPKWEQAILRCLERDPANRFVGTTEVVQALTGGAVPFTLRLPPLRPRHKYFVLALIILALIGGGFGYLRVRNQVRVKPTQQELAIDQEARLLKLSRRFDEAVGQYKAIVALHGAMEKSAGGEIETIENLLQQENALMSDAKAAEGQSDLNRAKTDYQKVMDLHAARELDAIESFDAVTEKMNGATDADIAKKSFANGVTAFNNSEYAMAKTYFNQALSRTPPNWPQRPQAENYSRRSANRVQQQQHITSAQNYFSEKNFDAVREEVRQVISASDADPALVQRAQDIETRIPSAPAVTPALSPPSAVGQIQAMTRDAEDLIEKGQFKAAQDKAVSIEQLKGDPSTLRQAIQKTEETRFQELNSRYLTVNKQNPAELQDLRGAFQQFAANAVNRAGDAKKTIDEITLQIAADTPTNPPAQPAAVAPVANADAAAEVQAVLNRYAQAVAKGDLDGVKAVRQLNARDEKKMADSLRAMKGKGFALRNCTPPEITGDIAKATCDTVLTGSKDTPPAQAEFSMKRINGQWIIVP